MYICRLKFSHSIDKKLLDNEFFFQNDYASCHREKDFKSIFLERYIKSKTGPVNSLDVYPFKIYVGN